MPDEMLLEDISDVYNYNLGFTLALYDFDCHAIFVRFFVLFENRGQN